MIEGTLVIQLEPIGVIRNSIAQSQRDTRWEEIDSEIIVDEKWRDALDGIDQFSHLWIVFYLDHMTAPDALHIRPMRHSDLPLVGIFATRSPQRPNPIGICAVQLINVHGNILSVRGLDALDGTPVLDIKRCLSRGDAIENTRVGEWVEKYWAESFGT